MENKSDKGDRVLYSIEEACNALAVGRTTLHGMLRAGKIHGVKIGKRGVRIPASELHRFGQVGGSE